MVRSVLWGVLRFRMLLAGLAAGLIVLGIVVLPGMHSAALPELSQAPVLEVQTEALGLSSQEVEDYITVPMENNLLDGVMGVWDVRSQSTPGLSTVDLYFEPGTTTLHARQLVEERLTNSFSLPAVAKPPLLIQPLSSSSRALMIGLNSSRVSPIELSYLARWIVKPRLSGVSGVANVAIFGQQDRQIQVQVDPAKLAAHHVTLQQVINTSGNAQLVSPLTYLEGAAPGTGGFIDGPNQRLDIRPVVPLGAPNNLAAVPISGAPGKVPLGAVGNVVIGHQPLIGDAMTSRGSGLVLLVQMLPGASLPGVTNGVERALSELRPALGGVTIDTSFFKPASYVTNSLHNMALGLVIAGVLALLALGALMLEARDTFIAALSIALSMLAATVLLDLLGYSMNAVVALGLLLASVVVVDDAVSGTHAFVWSVRGRAAEGDVPLQVTIVEGLVALRGVLVYGTLIALLLIAPVFFSKGLTSTFLHPMALTFAVAMIASMVMAFTVIPALGMLLFDRLGSKRRTLGLGTRISEAYERAMQWALSVPRVALGGVLVVGLVGLLALPLLHQPAPPRFKDRNLVVQWTGPTGASLPEMNRITSRVTGDLRGLPVVSDVAATLGRAVSGDQIVDSNSGQIYVELKPSADYDSAVNAVRDVVQSIPGMQSSVSTYESDVASGVLAPSKRTVTARIFGEDYGVMRSLGAQLQGLMAHVKSLGPAQMTLPTQEPNIQVAINVAAAHAAGVLPGDARRQASTLVSGLTVGNFFQDQAVFDAVVIGIPSVRSSVTDVRNLPIDTSSGGTVPLGTIANVSVRSDPVDIQHEALSRYVDVTAPVTGGSAGAASAAVQRDLTKLSYPLNYHAEMVGSTPEAPTSHVKFLTFVLAAAVGMLLLLQAAFGSWRLAALFMLALPSSLIGGALVAVISGQATSLGADAGLLAVLVLALRQGMVQIARIRRLHVEDGGKLDSALVRRAAHAGLAPALTSVVVIAAALLPFVFMGDVAGNEITHSAADVMLGGLVSSTILVLVLIPALCLAFGPSTPRVSEEDLQEAMEPPAVPAVTTSSS